MKNIFNKYGTLIFTLRHREHNQKNIKGAVLK